MKSGRIKKPWNKGRETGKGSIVGGWKKGDVIQNCEVERKRENTGMRGGRMVKKQWNEDGETVKQCKMRKEEGPIRGRQKTRTQTRPSSFFFFAPAKYSACVCVKDRCFASCLDSG